MKQININIMATKFYNNQARVFNRILNGENFEELLASEITKINSTQYRCSEEQAQKYRDQDLQDVLDVKEFFDKIKFFETPEIYKVNAWGYGQTNYENVKVLGFAGGSVVCVVDNNVYTVQKKKYTDKAEYTYLDSDRVRSTSWLAPYTAEKMIEQSLYNSYYGH